MVVACSTSAFQTTLAEALAGVSRMGFTHVDLIAIPQWNHISPAALADDFDTVAGDVEALLAEHSLTPAAMNAAFAATYDRSPAACEQRTREADAIARLVARLGVKVCAYYPGYRVEDRPWDDVLADAVVTMREVLATGQGHGVTFAPELHFATVFETVEQCTRLLEAAPELPVVYDPSHFAMQSIDLGDTRSILDRAVHVHLRDAAPDKMQERMGHGTVDFAWILDALDARGYSGDFSIEYLPDLEGGSETSIMELAAMLRERAG